MTLETDADLAGFLAQYDMWNPEHEARKWEAFAYARQHCPIPRTNAEGGFWLLTRHEDVRRVLEDPETFSSRNVTPRGSPVPLNPLDADPPYQQELCVERLEPLRADDGARPIRSRQLRLLTA